MLLLSFVGLFLNAEINYTIYNVFGVNEFLHNSICLHKYE